MECGLESPRPDRSDARDALPVRSVGADDGCERAEMIEQRLRRNPRDSWDCGERRFGSPGGVANRGALSESRACPVPYFGAAPRKKVKPKSRVLWAAGAKDSDPEIRQGQPDPPDRRRPQRSSVEMNPFDKEVGEACAFPQTSYLRPEPPPHDRDVQVTHGLALHDRALSHDVVTSPKRAALNGEPTLLEDPRHAAGAFVDVGDDVKHAHPTLAEQGQPIHHIGVPIEKQLALSRSESA